ncbi:hypothetical protein D3C78_1788170 [compost metagenome]
MVHGGQADVLVYPAVAGDVVRIEQFVVVGAGGQRAGVHHIVVIGYQAGGGRRIVGDVVEEGVTGVHGIGQADRRAGIACDQ